MRARDALSRLDEFHRRIEAILARATDMLVAAAPDTSMLAHVRWELMRVLREYQIFKHTEIFDPLLTSSTPERRKDAAALKVRCLAMSDSFVGHTERWTLAGVSEARAEYLTDAGAMTRRLATFLADERLNIRRLLEGVERTRAA